MGLTKTEKFSQEQNEIASIAKVLGHPARIAILQHLIAVQSCICGDIVDEVGLAQATISQHLKEMKRMGLIKGTISGTSMCYCIDADRFKEIKILFDKIFNNIAINCC